MTVTDSAEEKALLYLPSEIASVIRRSMGLYKGNISEIRLRAGMPVFITANGKNIICGAKADHGAIERTVRNLCGNSLYSHSETIREGYICTDGGIRAGVCGRAVTDGGRIIGITDISSVCIRIPHRVIGAADPIVKHVLDSGGGLLIFSKPGVGKTTVLRELAARLSAQPFNMRIAVVDTRFEICGALKGNYSIDALSGYPRSKGMETALRTLSPQIIICDEIASAEDARAIRNSAGAGVPVIASAHAGSRDELYENENIAELLNKNIFKATAELRRSGTDMTITIEDRTGSVVLC